MAVLDFNIRRRGAFSVQSDCWPARKEGESAISLSRWRRRARLKSKTKHVPQSLPVGILSNVCSKSRFTKSIINAKTGYGRAGQIMSALAGIK